LRFSIALIAFVLVVPSLLFAQQRPQGQSPVGSTSTGRSTPNAGINSRRNRITGSPSLPRIERDFEEALKLIESSYIDGTSLDYNAIFKSSVIGMLRSLDPHSNYYDRDEFEELKTDQRSEYYGIGASILNHAINGETDTFITSTFERSPAARVGLRFGDKILQVDGVKMTGKPSIEVRDKIRGPRGSVVRLTIERAADKRIQTVSLTRDAVPQPSIPDTYMIKPGVGYIDMTRGFNYTTSDELQESLARLHAQGMHSLILDLRNNPGGFLDQAIQVAEVFLPNGQLILTQKGRTGFRNNQYESKNNNPDLTPLVVLINGNSASASEIVAGAVQDHDRGLIVGTTSFGKGLVQSIIPLEYGAGLTLTSAKYFTPSGRLIQRDYTSGGFYDYYTNGANQIQPNEEKPKPSGQVKKTDTGREVYGGGGINPDEAVKPRVITVTQRRLLNPIFAFARELVNGRVNGLEKHRVQGPSALDHELQPSDLPITDAIYQSFRDFVAKNQNLKQFVPVLDHNRAFIELQLRYNMVTAAYGRVNADRVYVLSDDPQIVRALDALPRARNLAMSARQQRNQR
jgi:carboxyl-terminal processing protease